jgi:hypothetical protein
MAAISRRAIINQSVRRRAGSLRTEARGLAVRPERRGRGDAFRLEGIGAKSAQNQCKSGQKMSQFIKQIAGGAMRTPDHFASIKAYNRSGQ